MESNWQTATMTVCDTSSKHWHELRINRLMSIVTTYKWIIDAYVSDFYTKEYWSRLPLSLQTYFDAVEPPDLAWLLYSYGGKFTKNGRSPTSRAIPPLSLLALRQCISVYALQRTTVDTESEVTRKAILTGLGRKQAYVKEETEVVTNDGLLSTCEDNCHIKSKSSTTTAAGRTPNYKNGQCMDMQHIYRKHVKPKKQHEINNLGQIISYVSDAAGSKTVVDVGAGLGHLARILTFQHGLQVTTVEAAGGHAPKASELDKDLRKNLHKAKLKQRKQQHLESSQGEELTIEEKKRKETEEARTNDASVTDTSQASDLSRLSKEQDNSSLAEDRLGRQSTNSQLTHDHVGDGELPSHVICMVQPDIAASQFIEILGTRSDTDGNNNFVLAGLHACGDLTPTLLRVFLNCSTACGLASVGCCYMKMNAASIPESSELDNFPMSSYLKSLPEHSLSYEAREMACHFADAYYERLKANPPHLKIHSYRAALQLLVTSVDPMFKSGQARLISKNGANGTFTQYAADNLKKLNIGIESVPQTLLNECETLTEQWMRVVAFYTLRLSLAPLVESLVLCDRMLFLLEHGIPSVLVPIFDSNISPRNFALLARKP